MPKRRKRLAEVIWWRLSRMVLLPKKGDLSLCKNWRGICLLDVFSKIMSSILVARMSELMKTTGFDAQVGFRWDRGTIDGLFKTFVGLSKRKEHGLETWALFVDLVKAFGTRTNTNPNDTEANAAGRSVRACVARKSKS